ncbi:hypothetical protein PF007_g7769 [Phytophthora fragariae]|uniref:Uncharacterized protein n=1 Tax=Phytophthora fragariae TaxID=53985 RepID=A0A6A3SQR9_9STRA|nr:hypothetical protein PF007_g7769 [Phytophthora fragariae]
MWELQGDEEEDEYGDLKEKPTVKEEPPAQMRYHLFRRGLRNKRMLATLDASPASDIPEAFPPLDNEGGRRKEQEEPLRPLDEDGTKVGREEERQRGCLADDRWKAGREAECAERGSLQGEERTVEEDLEIKGPLTRKWIMNKLKEKGEAARTAKEAEQSAVEEGAAEKSEVAARTVVTNNPEVPAAVNSLTGMEVSGRNGREPANEGSNAVT